MDTSTDTQPLQLPFDDAPPPPASPPPAPPTRGSEPPPAGETARSAALWLGGTGAFLLLAAAAVLVAVRWDDIAAWAKLAGLLAVNAGVIVAGLRLDRTLPATARSLFTLGGLLVPVSAVAIGVQAELSWPIVALGGGGLTAAVLWRLERLRDSSLLRAVSLAAIVPAAGGLAALVGVPAAVLLAALALAAVATAPTADPAVRIASIAWATLAAALPLGAAVDDPLFTTSRVLADLGLTTDTAGWWHAASGLLSALALGWLATRERHDVIAFGALAAGAVGLTAAFTDLQPDATGRLLALAAALLVFEGAVWLVRDRAPWRQVLAALVLPAEVLLAFVTWAVLVDAATAVYDSFVDPATAIAAVVVGLAWLVADQRRRVADCQSVAMAWLTGGGWWPGTLGITASVVAVAAAASADATVTGWTFAALTVGLVLSGRSGAHWVGVATALAAVAFVAPTGQAVLAGLVVTAALAAAAALRVRPGVSGGFDASALTAFALITWAPTALRVGELVQPAAGWMAWSVGALAIALFSERLSDDPVMTGVGIVGRVAAALPVLMVLVRPGDLDLLAPAIALLAFSIVDTVRSRDLVLSAPAVLAAVTATVLALTEAGLSVAEVGVGLCVSAALAAGLVVIARPVLGTDETVLHRLRLPLIGLAALSGAVGFVYSTTDTGAMSTALMILGGAAVMVSVDLLRLDGVITGSLITIMGVWLRLDLAGVTWSEAYLAPLSLLLVVVGLALGDRATSWLTHGPAVVLLGGAALAERLLGGPGEHSLLAGFVAVLAIMLGAQRRLIAPLVIGTALVVTTTGHESLAYAASVPPFAWLAAGGTVLLTCAVLIERSATSPLETGRRLLDRVAADYR